MHVFTPVKVWDIGSGRNAATAAAAAAAQGHQGRGTKTAAREFLPELRGSGGAFSKFQALPLVARYALAETERERVTSCARRYQSDSHVVVSRWGYCHELLRARVPPGRIAKQNISLDTRTGKWPLNHIYH